MKVIIDIDEEDFRIMQHNVAVDNPLCPLGEKEIVTKIANGTPILDDAEDKPIPLDKIKKARDEITKQFVDLQDGSEEWRSYVNETVLECVEILDKLIEESED